MVDVSPVEILNLVDVLALIRLLSMLLFFCGTRFMKKKDFLGTKILAFGYSHSGKSTDHPATTQKEA